MKVPSTINGKLWAPARVRENQRPMAPQFPSMTSLQHFTIFFFKRQLVQAFQKITKRPQTTPTNKHVHFSLVFCLVFLVFLVGAWWGTCVFCLRVKGHPFPPSLCSSSELIRTLETPSARASDDGTDQSAHATCGVGFGGEGKRECTRQGGLTVLLPAKKLLMSQLRKSTYLTMLKRH